MLIHSQPIDSRYYKMFDEDTESIQFSERKIKKQYIGKMFGHLHENDRKIGIGLRFYWIWQDITGFFYNIKYSIRNHFKWRETLDQNETNRFLR